MRLGRRMAATVGAAATMLVSVALSTPAHAVALVELQSRPATAAEAAALTLAADSHGCDGNEASNNSYVHVCFVRNGDVLWVYDDEADGERAVGHLITPNAHYFCQNAYGAGVRWVNCGFSATPENTTIWYFGTTRNGEFGQDHHETSWQYESSS